MRKLVFVVVLISLMNSLTAQTPLETGLKAITPEAVKGQLEFLASDWMEGRGTGTRGEYMAGDYLASLFRIYGIQPFGDDLLPQASRRQRFTERTAAPSEKVRTYFQNITLIEYMPGTDQVLSVISVTPGGEASVDFENNTDFSVRTGNVGLTVKAPLVFAGYGFTDEKNGYDDYKKLDVNGKVVVILSGFPGYRDENSAAYKKFRPEGRMAQYAIERDKTARAEKLGASGIILVRPGTDPLREWAEDPQTLEKASLNGAETPARAASARMALPEDTLSGNIPVFTVTSRVVQRIMAGTGIDFSAFEKQAAEKMLPSSALLIGKSVEFKTSVSSRIVNARNVLGYIEGENKNEVIVVGAHYDHMGKNNGWIWNGADDNASGVVGVMTMAKAFAASGKKPEKTIVFAAWTGEEKGLLGSEYFVNTFDKNKTLVLNLNYDMIARNEPGDSLGNKAEMMFTSSWPEMKALTEKNLSQYNIGLDISYQPLTSAGGGSDHAHFAAKGVPVFYFMAAMHPDYHQPSDETSKVNWKKMTDIIRIGFLNTWELANRNEPVKP